jgi:hypothetical protein
MGDVELMALYWTVSGPVEVHVGREWSLFDWRDRCANAARVGFRGLGLWHADVSHQLETRSLQEMAKIFRDAGLQYLEVEFLADFFVPAGEPARADSDRLRRQLFETAVAFDAHHIKVGNIPETPCELDRLIEEYAALCDDAAQHTNARVAYEIIPFDPNVHTLEAGLRLVTEAGRANGGLAIDTWHMGKLHIPPEALKTIPGEYPTDRWSTCPIRSTRSSTTGACPARASSTSRVTSRLARRSAIGDRGESRSSPRSFATSRSRRNSTAPTRRRSRSSARA